MADEPIQETKSQPQVDEQENQEPATEQPQAEDEAQLEDVTADQADEEPQKEGILEEEGEPVEADKTLDKTQPPQETPPLDNSYDVIPIEEGTNDQNLNLDDIRSSNENSQETGEKNEGAENEENTENIETETDKPKNEENPDDTQNSENIGDQTGDITGENLDETDEKDLTGNLDETLEKEKSDADTENVVPVKKAVKRKERPNKFADGNLILEEDDEEINNQAGSPGPPPLEPIGQNLDESDKLNLNIQGDFNREALGATTPDRGEATLDEEYQEIEAEIKPTREEIIERYKALVEERDQKQNTNNQLHHKLADYYRKRKSEEAQNQPLFDKSSQEQEQRYIKYLSTIEGLRKQLERERWEAEKEMEDLKEKCELKQSWVNEDRVKFNKVKKEAAQKSVSIHTGKAPSNKELDMYMQRENAKELEVINVRLENIKLKNQLKKKEMELKAKEELGEGLHMIDFEQLKIENQTYNEKIEERNEELMKLKKKINNTVQILTHVKEKLQFVFVENDKEKLNLNFYDEQVKKNRDILNRIKQSRDALRVDNGKLKQNSGLLGNTVLLRDFEECVDQNDNLESQIEYLKRKHAELILNSKGIKQKIAQTKTP